MPAPSLPSPVGAPVVAALSRGTLRITGDDRAAFLHGLVSNDVRSLVPGAGRPALLLTPKGKLLSVFNVLATSDALLLDLEASLAGRTVALLEKYAPFSKSRLEDLSSTLSVVHLAGPGAGAVLGRSGLGEDPLAPHAHREAILEGLGSGPLELRVAGAEHGFGAGFDLRVPASRTAEVVERLGAAGAAPRDDAAVEAARIAAGIPRWGTELDETVLPDEAWLTKTAVSYSKGCYIGQETVARIKTYGHVNRHLVHLEARGPAAPGAPVLWPPSGPEIGRVTSATARGGITLALAYVKRDAAEPGTEVLAGATPAVVRRLPWLS